jgi:hypothetical protein
VEAQNPIASGKGCLERQRVHDIIDGVNHVLNLTILRGGVGAWHPKLDVMGEEERARGGVIEPSSIVVLDTPDGATKLHEYISKEVREGGESIRLVSLRKSPWVMHAIIKNK